MDPAQLKNRNALQGVLAMLKGSQAPAQIAKVISIALGTDSLYTFGEIESEASVQALKDTDQKAWLDVLRIFKSGVYRDYAEKAAQCTFLLLLVTLDKKLISRAVTAAGVTLDRKQIQKLRIATFIVLGSAPPVTFDATISALAITAEEEADRILEMSRYFMIAVDKGLVHGRLDSRSRKIHIDEIAPLRDVSPNEYSSMLATVDAWIAKTDEQLRRVEDHARSIRQRAEQRRADDERFESRRELADLEASKGKKRGGGAGGDGPDDHAAGSAGGVRNTRAR